MVVDAGSEWREDWREAHSDTAEKDDGVRAVDGVGDAEGAGEGAEGRGVDVGGVEPGSEARAVVGAEGGEADIGFKAAAAAVGSDGDRVRVFFE